MAVAYTPWPDDIATLYREKGYWRDEPLTQIITRHLDTRAPATAIICRGRTFTYDDLNRLSARLAAALEKQGLHQGDTALVRMPNCAEFYLIFFALLKCGVVALNALHSHGLFELRSYVGQIRPRLVILSYGNIDAQGAGIETDCSFLLAALENEGVERSRILLHAIRSCSVDVCLDGFTWATGEGLSVPENEQPIEAADAKGIAFFQLSGGSTGAPKLIPRTHNDYAYSIRQSVEVCGLDERCRYLCALPAPHNFPLSSPGALGVLYAGGTVVMAPDPSPTTCFPLIERHSVTWTSLVPPLVSLWLAERRQNAADLSSLEVVQVGGAKLSPSLAERVPNELGCRLQQVFGMAEGLVAYTRFDDDAWTVFNTQGRPMSPDDDIRILNESGLPVMGEQIGELWTRGPYTFRGYYMADTHNSRVFDNDGFYCTGDLVRQLPDGNLVICGRSKDQINRGGEKIDAQEVEDVLLAHPQVVLAAVVAMPDPVMGERSCAFVVTTAEIRGPHLRRYLRQRALADYKLPDRFVFATDLPKTPVGKIDKNDLRQRLQRKPQSLTA